MLTWLLGLATAATLAPAWWYPGTPESAALSWTGVLFLSALMIYGRKVYRVSYLTGSAVYVIGFYWLYWTIKDFGGFNSISALAVFALFFLGEAVQFLLFALFVRHSPRFFRSSSLDIPLAWIAAERLWVRIFPWEVGHTQIAFPYLVQAADIFGAPVVTFLMFWLCAALLRWRSSPVGLIAPIGAWIFAVGYGVACFESIEENYGEPLNVALIQANVSVEEKHNQRFVVANRERYMELSKQVSKPGLLIVWPESVITSPIPEIDRVPIKPSILPYDGNGSAYLFGALTYNSKREVFNSGVGISHEGKIAPPYHKIILMPFGEYMPFSGIFPWLDSMNPNAGGFSPGKEVSVLQLATKNADGVITPVSVTPLICYEDIVPRLARSATINGAEVLANLTNDAWFGNTIAPYQHHLIASFRAIENRRFLIRSTNTGLTAIVDPFGRTLGELRPFTEGTLEMSINRMTMETIYSKWVGELPWQILSYLTAILAAIGFARKRTARSR